MSKDKLQLISGVFLLGILTPVHSSQNIPVYSFFNDNVKISNTLSIPNENSFSTTSTICSTNSDLFNPCIINRFNTSRTDSQVQISDQRTLNNLNLRGTISKNLASGLFKGSYNLKLTNSNNSLSLATNLYTINDRLTSTNTTFQANLPNDVGSIKGRLNFNSYNRIESKIISFQRRNFGTTYFESVDNFKRFSLEHRTLRSRFELRTGIGTEIFPDQSTSSSFNLKLIYYLNN